MSERVCIIGALLSEAKLSELTGLASATLRRWRCVGSGPAYYKLGPGPKAKVGYRREDVEAWLESGRRDPEAAA